MRVTRIADARPYHAPGHSGMVGLRLQGKEASDTGAFWVGLSHFLPGGGAESGASDIEKVYVALSGQLTVMTDDGETVLGPLDSCRLAPGERREIVNRTSLPASMLVIIPND
ncbi:cupin domain-containing protein [Microbaculum sp. FT89]|uniref:cupin domain-containing protein n=1 Tax=Microbaculum sp. FT89 TaxID=3447298 RepID=UPI003F534A11